MRNKILIQFNEANFDLIESYVKKYNLPHLKHIIKVNNVINTSSENKYEYLEPWIQWYSFYVNLRYEKHNTFHLGDCLKNDHKAFSESLADKGMSIGIFGSMNLRPHKNYNIYIPDAWTESKSDSTLSSKIITSTMKKLVNENAKLKLSIFNALGILHIIGFPTNYNDILNIFIAIKSFLTKSRSELASLFDYFFLKYSLNRIKKNNLEFSMVFLNGFAHVQHHYLLNSEFIKGNNPSWYSRKNEDHIYKSLKIYDSAFRKLKDLQKDFDIWIITGLSQQAFNKPLIYWRIRNIQNIMSKYFNFKVKIHKRMTRDFEIKVEDSGHLEEVKHFLESAELVSLKNNMEDQKYGKAFDFINQVDKNSIFASFVYSGTDKEIYLKHKNKEFSLRKEIDFVAIKNGEHNQKGWVSSSSEINCEHKDVPIWDLSKIIFSQ